MHVVPILMAATVTVSSAQAIEPTGGWQIVVLGVAQDGGMPHPGCTKSPCADVHAGARPAEKVSCLGLVNHDLGVAYLIDATPDFPPQLHALTGGRPPDGIFLTHAHVGHYAGLIYLGKEAMSAKGILVYGTERMLAFLRDNAPWRLLVEDGHVAPREMTPDRSVDLPGGLSITPLLVPHRDEFTDTVGFLIAGPRARALYIPDIDKWGKWDRSLRDLAEQVDILLVDGTFASTGELPGRDISQVPHPLMSETRAIVDGTPAELWFIHLNHSNPALVDGKDVAREGMRFPL
jgi:pyrroloquinoline quinone biosynthesis protein B